MNPVSAYNIMGHSTILVSYCRYYVIGLRMYLIMVEIGFIYCMYIIPTGGATLAMGESIKVGIVILYSGEL